MCKKGKKTNFPDFFKIDDNIINNNTSIANKFNDFFTTIGSTLASEIQTTPHRKFSDFLGNDHDSNFTFKLITEDDINKILTSLDSKTSSGIDNISNTLLKSIQQHLSKPLSLIVNQMLKTGIFPDKLKIAKVIPLFKKGEKLF